PATPAPYSLSLPAALPISAPRTLFCGANSADGSRFPCSATFPAATRRASRASALQSRPTASQPLFIIAASQGLPPLVNRMLGTREPSRCRKSFSKILLQYERENLS